MAVQIQLRRDTAANWADINPVLQAGELGFDLTSTRLKLGDGVTPWNDLPWYEEGLIGTDGNVKPSTGASGVALNVDLDDSDLLSGLTSRIIGPDRNAPLIDQGSWEPTLQATTSNPSAVTYDARAANYIRTGNLVFVQAIVGTTSVSGGSGSIRIGGLPFTVRGALGATMASSPVELQNVTLPANTVYVSGMFVNGTTTLQLNATRDGIGVTSVSIESWTNFGRARFGGVYITDGY